MARTQFDAVIIGSGAGGASVAHTLARAGKTVLVLEKGPLFLTQDQAPTGLSDFKRDELQAAGPEKRIRVPGVANHGVSYFSSHVEPDLNDEPHIYRGLDGKDRATIEGYTAQVVGGGTQVYGGVSLRFTPLDFRLRSFNDGRTDLRDDPKDDIRREARDWPIGYDVDKEGFSATYLQYTYARCCSIFRKGGFVRETLRTSGAKIVLGEPAERALGIQLLRFAEALADVEGDYMPHHLTAYLFDLAKSYSTFFENCPVLEAESPAVRDSRLLLCDLTARTIRQGLELLGIQVVEKM